MTTKRDRDRTSTGAPAVRNDSSSSSLSAEFVAGFAAAVEILQRPTRLEYQLALARALRGDPKTNADRAVQKLSPKDLTFHGAVMRVLTEKWAPYIDVLGLDEARRRVAVALTATAGLGKSSRVTAIAVAVGPFAANQLDVLVKLGEKQSAHLKKARQTQGPKRSARASENSKHVDAINRARKEEKPDSLIAELLGISRGTVVRLVGPRRSALLRRT